MIRCVASTPSTPGMNRSIRIRSGGSSRAIAIAWAPSLAVQAISCSRDDSTTRRNASRASTVSLTIPILMVGDAVKLAMAGGWWMSQVGPRLRRTCSSGGRSPTTQHGPPREGFNRHHEDSVATTRRRCTTRPSSHVGERGIGIPAANRRQTLPNECPCTRPPTRTVRSRPYRLIPRLRWTMVICRRASRRNANDGWRQPERMILMPAGGMSTLLMAPRRRVGRRRSCVNCCAGGSASSRGCYWPWRSGWGSPLRRSRSGG